MKKTVVVLTSILAILLSACTAIFTPTPGTGPTADIVGTSEAEFHTAVAASLTAQSTPPFVSVTDTATVPVESPVLSATDTQAAPLIPSLTFTSAPNLTTTPVTATSGPANPTNAPASPTFTATLAAGQATPTWTPGVRTYGTLPPAVPFNQITLINKSGAEAYISLHVDLQSGSNTVIEYPVEGTIRIKAPTGPYSYVAWVGGKKMIGIFRLTATNDISITLYKDKVVIK